MDFKQQYKAEMQNISPSEEQCERIRAKVYEEIKNPQSVQNAPKRRKPLPIKAIAITGASAACLVLVSALTLQMTQKMDGVLEDVCSAAPNELYAMEESDGRSTDDDMSVGSEIGQQAYDNDLLSPTADGNSISNSKDSFSEQTDSAKSAYASSLIIKIIFSEDMSKCEVEGLKSQNYAISNEAPLTLDNEELLEEFPAIQSNIGETLFIYANGDKLWVYDENKQFIGCFIQTS